MLPARANAPSSPDPAELLAAFAAHTERGGRSGTDALAAARQFLSRWPDPGAFALERLEQRLSVPPKMGAFITFLMTRGHLRPGYDYLIARRFKLLRQEMAGTDLARDVERFDEAAEALGFAPRTRAYMASQAAARLLIETGRRLDELCEDDVACFEAAVESARVRIGQRLHTYTACISYTRVVLYHLGVLSEPPSRLGTARQSWIQRMAGVPDELKASFVAYLERLAGIHAPQTVTARASHLAQFGRFLAEVDPDLSSLADLDRCRHIEPWLSAVSTARHHRTGEPIVVAEQKHRILAVRRMLEDVAEWGWPDVPYRRLIFASDLPRIPRPLPRYLPPEADRRLAEVLEARPQRIVADALLLQRACGLRIGELLDLELDCVHEIPGNGHWLKVPLGKLMTERMVPLDIETVALIDRIVLHRSPGLPLRHPRSGRLVEFLFTHRGRRVSQQWLRSELSEAATEAGLDHAHPHQLRHTYATALVNAGCSLQALMALLGHASAEMSLRYGRLFDQTVRENYERALAQAKASLGPVLPEAIPVHLTTDWRRAPLVKARLAGGYCLRSLAQGPCAYANICEHCPNLRSDKTFLPILRLQRVDADALLADAEERGWGVEAARHRRLIERIDTLIADADAG
jgi:integrase